MVNPYIAISATIFIPLLSKKVREEINIRVEPCIDRIIHNAFEYIWPTDPTPPETDTDSNIQNLANSGFADVVRRAVEAKRAKTERERAKKEDEDSNQHGIELTHPNDIETGPPTDNNPRRIISSRASDGFEYFDTHSSPSVLGDNLGNNASNQGPFRHSLFAHARTLTESVRSFADSLTNSDSENTGGIIGRLGNLRTNLLHRLIPHRDPLPTTQEETDVDLENNDDSNSIPEKLTNESRWQEEVYNIHPTFPDFLGGIASAGDDFFKESGFDGFFK